MVVPFWLVTTDTARQGRSGFSVQSRVFAHPGNDREFEALVRYMMRPVQKRCCPGLTLASILKTRQPRPSGLTFGGPADGWRVLATL